MAGTEVGTAYVTILPSAKGFAKNLRKEIAKEFAGSNLDKLIAEQLGETRVTLPVDPVLTERQVDTSELRRPVTLPVEVDARQAAVEVRQAARAAERAAPPVELKIDVDRGRFRSLMGRLFTGAADVIQGVAETATKSLNQMAANFTTNVAAGFTTVATTGTSMTVATGGLNLLAGALLAAAGAAAIAATGFVALAPAVLVVGGAFGSAMTAAVGLGGTLTVLKMGLTGVGDALEEIGKDGKVSAETLAKLSPNARALVRELEKLKGPLGALRRFVQDRLLAGMNRQIRDLAAKWLPALRPMLGDLADRFNAFARRVFQALGDPTFIRNIRSAMSGFGDAVDRVGRSMGPLIDAFGRLARASKPFLLELSDMVGDLIDKFSAWIKSADESGKLDRFMRDAAQALRDIWDIGGLVVGIIGDIIEILFPTSKDVSGSFLGGVKAALQDIKDWLDDPKNQKKIQDWIDKIKDAAVAVGDAALTIAGWVDKVQGWVDKIDGWKASLSTAWQGIKDTAREKWDEIIRFFSGLPGRAAAALSELPGKVREKVVEMAGQAGYALGQAIGSWISLVAGLPGRAASALAALPGQIAGVWRRAKPIVETAVSVLIAGAIRLVKDLPGRARDTLKNIGSTLVQAGRALIDGLLRGIREKVPALDGLLGWISSKIPDWKGPYDRDRVLLLPAGRAIMDGLIRGIDSQVPALRSELSTVTDVVAGVPFGAEAGMPSAAAVPAPAPVVLGFGGDAPDSFMRWVRENVRIYYGGQAQAAFGS